jgi:murein DD-endopeptidase MepM/ murein hydrolase activator NlpD
MNRSKNESSKNRGFYIAVCCCVLVIAIIGYVSWFAGNTAPETPNHTDSSYTEVSDVPNLSEISKIPVKEEKSAPERTTVPVEKKTAPVAKNVIAEDNTPSFSKPVDGKVIGDYSGDNLIFYKTLSDWRSHDGVDFKASEGEDVSASADGVVESVYSDSMGNCIVIDHENGLKTMYANLADSETDLTGQNVKKGDKIGTVGKSALADLTEEAHLHFEILKDGRPVDPSEYLK